MREITPLKTDLWVEEDCGGSSKDQGAPEPGASKEKSPGKHAAPPKAAHDFEVAATKAVKQWRYRPGEMDDVLVDVYTTIVVEFTPLLQGAWEGSSLERWRIDQEYRRGTRD